MNRNQFSKALTRLIFIAFVISLVQISRASSLAAEKKGDLANQSVNGKQSARHTKRASGDYDSYGSHVDYFEPSPVDDSKDESYEPLPATADCPPICGNDGADYSYPSFQSSIEDDSDESHGADGDQGNHDLEGNVMWT